MASQGTVLLGSDWKVSYIDGQASELLGEAIPGEGDEFICGRYFEEQRIAEIKHHLDVIGEYSGILNIAEKELNIDFRKGTANGGETIVVRLEPAKDDSAEHTERLISVLDNTPLVVRMFTRNGDIIYLNKAGRKMMGIRLHDNLDIKVKDCHEPSAYADLMENGIPAAIEDGVWYTMCPYKTSEGKVISTFQSLIAHKSVAGQVEYFSTIARDITLELQEDEDRKLKEERLKLAEQVAQMGYFELNVETDAVEVSEEAMAIFELDTKGKLSFSELLLHVHPNDIGRVHRAALLAARNKSNFRLEFRLLATSGLKNILANGRVIRGDHEGSVTILWIIQNITDRKISEEALRNSEKRLKTAEQIANMGHFEWLVHPDEMYLSDELYSIMELKKIEFGGKMDAFLHYVHPEDVGKVRRAMSRYIRYKPQYKRAVEFRIITRKGNVKYLYSKGETIFGPDKRPVRRIGIVMDITSRVKIERMLKDAERKKNELVRQREKIGSEAIIFGQEEERQRISMEIHDGLGQILTAVNFNTGYLESLTEGLENDEINSTLNNIFELLKESRVSIRTIADNLMPKVLLEFGLYGAVRKLGDSLFGSTSINFELILPADKMRFEKSMEISIYRIVQELLNNTVKHAQANNVGLRIGHSKKGLTIYLTDDGVGFDLKRAKATKKGKGISNIKQRIKFLSGEYYNKIRNGTRLYIVVPLQLPGD